MIETNNKIIIEEVPEEEPATSTSTWHGETDIADWIAFGGNLPSATHSRDYQSMFDNEISTLWVGGKGEQNRLIVTFKEFVMFYDLRIITRSADKNYFANSYKSMCLVLDDDSTGKMCTPADFDIDNAEEIKLGPESPITVKKVELIVQPDELAQIADLKIQYTTTTQPRKTTV